MSDKENQPPKGQKKVERKLTVREMSAGSQSCTFLYERKLIDNQGSTCPFCLEGNFKLVSGGEKNQTDDFQWRCGEITATEN